MAMRSRSFVGWAHPDALRSIPAADRDQGGFGGTELTTPGVTLYTRRAPKSALEVRAVERRYKVTITVEDITDAKTTKEE